MHLKSKKSENWQVFRGIQGVIILIVDPKRTVRSTGIMYCMMQQYRFKKIDCSLLTSDNVAMNSGYYVHVYQVEVGGKRDGDKTGIQVFCLQRKKYFMYVKETICVAYFLRSMKIKSRSEIWTDIRTSLWQNSRMGNKRTSAKPVVIKHESVPNSDIR